MPGNVTPHAEFNIYNDAAAANVVFSSGIPVTLIGLDVCNPVFLEKQDLSSLNAKRRLGRTPTAHRDRVVRTASGERHVLAL